MTMVDTGIRRIARAARRDLPAPTEGVDSRSALDDAESYSASRSGGMADAPDSKSGPRKRVWVQVPPSVLRRPRSAPVDNRVDG